MILLEALAIFSFFEVFYAYFGYPLVLYYVIKLREIGKLESRRTRAETLTREVPLTIVIAARNEERHIEQKIQNTFEALSKLPQKQLHQVLVASDCSDDATDEIVGRFSHLGVELVRSPERKGKEHAQKLAIERSTGDIIVFTDTKTRLRDDALMNFIEHFVDPDVGAVSSTDVVETGDSGHSGEGFYVRYEMWLRRLETRFNSVVGLSGSCFAVRKQIALGIRTDVPSDFCLLLESVRRGFRGVLAPDVICYYSAVKTEEEEFARKVRTILRGITAFFACREVLNFRKFGVFSWQVASHKLARWLVPWFIVIGYIATILAGASSLLFLLLAYGVTLFFSLALLGYLEPAFRNAVWIKVPLFFTITNAAIGMAWVKFLRGQRSVKWDPSAKV
jgi:cellulose synthase/poly-beta-1,6-N-acetylglucosamine synthase-like glycosyltransferase